MVSSWPGDAWLTSIVNFFMFLFYPFFVSVSWRLQLEACSFYLYNLPLQSRLGYIERALRRVQHVIV